MPILRSFILLVACSLVPVALADPAYSPCIFNASGSSLGFVAQFADGTASPGSLPSGSGAWQHINGRQLDSLIVIRRTQKRSYTPAQLNQLRRDHPVRDEVWVIDEHGITLDDRRHIDLVRKRAARTHQ